MRLDDDEEEPMTTEATRTPTKSDLKALLREIELYLRFWDMVRAPL